jgi:hypothetical protein
MPNSNAISRYVTDCQLTQETKLGHYSRVVRERRGQVVLSAAAGPSLYCVSLVALFTGLLDSVWSMATTRLFPPILSFMLSHDPSHLVAGLLQRVDKLLRFSFLLW